MTERQALVLVGHGSHYNSDSARPVFAHADRIRDQGSFAEVREAFWKEEPSLREVLRTVESPEVFVVPAFVSEGYFVEEVLPRELGLAKTQDSDPYGTYEGINRRNATVHYTEPFGTHDAMTDVVAQRAREAARGLAGADVDPAGPAAPTDPDAALAGPDVGLAVVGHGTERNPKSAAAVHSHADRIRERGTFGEVRALFMDEPPYVVDATDHFETNEIVAVPLFVADGFHTREEIPELLGLESDGDDYRVPTRVGDHRIWYSGAVGTHPGVADVIVERAREAGSTLESGDPRTLAVRGESAANRERGASDEEDRAESVAFAARRSFVEWLASDDSTTTRTWGQLAITTIKDDPRRYELRHRADLDANLESLEALADASGVSERVRFDNEGAYRPLSGAPTLPTGWVCHELDARDLVRAVEFVYPASIENWHLEREDSLDVTRFQETAERQTGIYDVISDLDSDELAAAAEACCHDEVCAKRRAWDESDDQSIPAERGEGEIPCREPCSLFVAAARAFVREERDGAGGPDVPDAAIRVGNVDHEANPYRVRYRQAMRRAKQGDEEEQPPQPSQATAGGDPR